MPFLPFFKFISVGSYTPLPCTSDLGMAGSMRLRNISQPHHAHFAPTQSHQAHSRPASSRSKRSSPSDLADAQKVIDPSELPENRGRVALPRVRDPVTANKAVPSTFEPPPVPRGGRSMRTKGSTYDTRGLPGGRMTIQPRADNHTTYKDR